MYKTIVRSIIVSALTVLFGFIFSVFLARLLGPEDRGVYGSILMVATLISSLSQFGLAQGYVYQTRESKKNSFNLLIKSTLLISFSTILICILTKIYFLPKDLIPVIYVIGFLSFISSINLYFQNASHIDKSLYFYNLIKVSVPFLNIILLGGYYLFSKNLSTYSFITIIIISTLFSLCVLGYGIFSQEKNRPTTTSLKLSDITNYSLKMYGASVVGLFINSIDKIIMLTGGSMREFGLYSVAYALSRLVGIIPETISIVIYSRFAGNSEKELARVVKLIFSCLFIPLMSLCLIIIMLSTWLIPIIFGNEYTESVLPFMFLTCECIISGLGWLLSQRFNASGRPGLVLLRQLVSVIPLIYIYFYQFEFNILLTVSLALLSSSIIRLTITMVVYKKVFNEQAPKLYPTMSELKSIFHVIKHKGNNTA